MKIGNLEVNNPLILGPMAGVTDWAFRTVCAELGANITVTEMVSSRALVYKDKKSASCCEKMRAVSAALRSSATILTLWLRARDWHWRSPAAIFWILIWVAPCRKLPIPVTAAA